MDMSEEASRVAEGGARFPGSGATSRRTNMGTSRAMRRAGDGWRTELARVRQSGEDVRHVRAMRRRTSAKVRLPAPERAPCQVGVALRSRGPRASCPGWRASHGEAGASRRGRRAARGKAVRRARTTGRGAGGAFEGGEGEHRVSRYGHATRGGGRAGPVEHPSTLRRTSTFPFTGVWGERMRTSTSGREATALQLTGLPEAPRNRSPQ